MEKMEVLRLLKQEIMPALGCTEPIAIAYASAKARAVLGKKPDKAFVRVSRNILKNAMGVGIPGTDVVGLEMAAALGIIGGDSEAILEVLHNIRQEDVEEAVSYAGENVKTELKDTEKKLYIEVFLMAGEDSASVIIEDSHTNITKIIHGKRILYEKGDCREIQNKGKETFGLTIEEIYRFVNTTGEEDLEFLEETARMNWSIAQEGLKKDYGLGVGRSIYHLQNSTQEYAAAMSAAAADARMAGCRLPVMTVCGSGNQGITATVPVIAAAKRLNRSRKTLYRALALSCLVTIHVKQYIGKLSPLCGCGMGSSIGVCCALAYMQGGGLKQIDSAVKNMIADVSGIICDGAKAGCALKIATVITSAFQCAALALRNSSAGELDGIVSENVEISIQNLGALGNLGMSNTDQVILDMMVCK